MSDDNLKYTISADDNPVKQTLDRVKSHFAGLQSHVTNVTAGIQGALGKVNTAMAAVATALAGGAAIKQSIDATKQFTMEAQKLARVLGTNATEASTLNIALGDIFSDADTYSMAASKLAKEIRTNEQSLRDMGLQTRNANGDLRPLKDLMMDSITVVNGYKQGIDRNIAAQTMWGKGASEVAGLLKLNNAVVEEARAKQERLGLVVGVENVEATKAYRAAMNDAGDVMLGIKKAIGDAVMPVLTQLAKWFSDIGPAAVVVMKGAIGGLISVFWALKAGVEIVWQVLAGVIETLTVAMAAIGEGFFKILTGDLAGGVAAFRGATESIKDTWSSRMDNIVKSSQDARDKIWNLFAQPTPVKTEASTGKSAAGLVKGPSRLAEWEAELNAQKQAHAQQNAENGTFFEFTKQREQEFWEAKKSIATKSNGETFAVQAKITGALLELQKDAFEQRLAQMKREESEAEQNFAVKSDLAKRELALIIQRYGAESKQAEDAQRHVAEIDRQARDQRNDLRRTEIGEIEANGLHQVELARQRAQLLLDAGMTDRATMLQAERAFEDQKYQIQMQALQERQQLLDPDKNPVEAARVKGELLELERQHQMRITEIRAQAALENAKWSLQAMQSTEAGLARVFSQIGTQIRTVGQLMRSVFQMMGQVAIGILAQIAAKWIAQNILMRVLGKASALGVIAEKSAEAGASGVASMAGAPWPINMTAPIFGAAMAAAAMAFAPAASASQGFDIPAGVSPITQLHPEEMVLPKPQADVIRDMANGGGGGGLPSIAIYAMDGADVKRVLTGNPEALAAALDVAERRGHIKPRY